MRNEILNRCDLLAKNKEIISKAFIWESDYMAIAAASIITSAGVLVDKSNLTVCNKILKKNTGWTSVFRGNSKITLIAKMALSENPEEYLLKVMSIYELMKQNKLSGNEYRVMAAMAIADRVDISAAEDYILRTKELYKRMSKEHAFLTSSEDIPFATLLAISDKDIDLMVEDMERSYDIISRKFLDKNAVQSLTHILTLCNDSPEVKCKKVLDVYGGLKASKHAFSSGYELCVLGVTALSNLSAETLVNMICDADDIISTKKGFGGLSVGKSERRLLALQVVMSVTLDNSFAADSAIMTSLLATTIAMETCMIICSMAASSAATSAATN